MTKITNIEHQRKREIIESAVESYKIREHCPFCGEDNIIRDCQDGDSISDMTVPVECIDCEKK